MIAIARRRLPTADLRAGGAEHLPWEPDAFDVVTAFNSLQFADDVGAALGEARRVARPGGHIAVCTWGRRQDCELKPVLDALAESRVPARKDPEPPGEPGELERLARESGLVPTAATDVETPYEVSDRATLKQALLIDAALLDIDQGADEAVQEAVDRAAPFQRPDGSYRFENRFRYIIAAVTG